MRRFLWLLAAVALVLGLCLYRQGDAPNADGSRADASREASTARAPVLVDTIAGSAPHAAAPTPAPAGPYPEWLPQEAHAVLARIAQGGPHPYRQDGGVFHNREHRLPAQARGYYREYTVATPGSSDRGMRRLITGGDPVREYWYTGDHYRSFRRFEVGP